MGKPESTEREFRRTREELKRMHERSYLSSAAAQLGEALFELARLDEAEERRG
ncbi:MAG TPA: hypothetical protein VE753_05965 [Gaiellaceae bacterium]|nr:hypothetical protein [Gaiellaceae bacterium]